MGIHDTFIDLADQLIRKHGRPAVIRRVTDPAPTDTDKPWRVVPATGGLIQNYSVIIVEDTLPVDRPEGVKRSREDKVVFLAAKNLPIRITLTDLLVDNVATYAIQNISEVYPGPDIIMYSLLVRKWPPRSNS